MHPAGWFLPLLLVPLLSGCLAPEPLPGPFDLEDPAAVPEPLGPDRAAEEELSSVEEAGGNASVPPPDLALHLQVLPAVAPERLALAATISLLEPPRAQLGLHLAWHLEEALLASEQLQWRPLDGTTQSLERSMPAPPGPAALRFTAYWDGFPAGVATLERAVVVPAGVRLVVDARPEYTADVGQPSFRLDLAVPFQPWDAENALHVLDRAATIHGFPYHAVYHADMDAHYVRMVNGTSETWVIPGVVSRSWMILHNGTLAGSAADGLEPAAGDTVEFRYVQCYATGHCDGVQ